MHHGGDTVAHGSFVAPGRETGKRTRPGFVCSTCCCKNSQCGNDQTPLGPMARTPRPSLFGLEKPFLVVPRAGG